ncbi:hypothetical protein [Agromyces ramosus]|uniref:High-affinity Fe2+/Pb2+ permease n=1 Tax=Agromyces ramosus TaxID=33879 RepID=A0ABU0R516_9MICO|nr:hypothetical protein [Agromyces ramosus]MDQ0893160.1 high-affinity Fe2+/Pb2+ permease [Agromyces ramosus]
MNETSPDAATGDSAVLGGRPAHKPSPLVRAAFVTEESVYGVILVSGMIVASGGHGASSWSVFWTVVVTVIVFWAAHLYAGTVAHHGLDHDRIVGLRDAFRSALRRSLGLLASALIPAFILLLGATRAIPDPLALWAALWSGVIVLAVLGFIAFRRRGAPWPMQVVGALATAAFGIAMIVLKAVIH